MPIACETASHVSLANSRLHYVQSNAVTALPYKNFRVVFISFSPCVRRNTHNTTSGFKMDLGF